MSRVQSLVRGRLGLASERIGALLLLVALIAGVSALIGLFVRGHWAWGVAVLLVLWVFAPEDPCRKVGGHDGPCDCAPSASPPDDRGSKTANEEER